jgi:hypothetical protein
MPAPMMQPMPSETRLHTESVRFKGTPPWVTKACTQLRHKISGPNSWKKISEQRVADAQTRCEARHRVESAGETEPGLIRPLFDTMPCGSSTNLTAAPLAKDWKRSVN